MDRRAIWPEFRAEWILHEDADVIVVDKPSGIPAQAPDPRVQDDLPSRLARFLGERDGLGRAAYLGTHQRLDADTSGVILFTKRREVNASIAAAFEGRTVRKRYVVAVQGDVPRGRITLRHHLSARTGGRVEVVRGRERGAREAVTVIDVIERRGDRALLSAEIETGRTHQIRAQLAHVGAPVAGDLEYGGAAAARLLLHASELGIAHPSTRRELLVRAKVPAELTDFVHGGAEDPFATPERFLARLRDAVGRRYALGRAPEHGDETTVFRLVHEGGDGLPGVAADVYDAYVVVQLYDERARANEAAILDAFAALGFDGVYVKRRPKQANTVVDTRRDELAPATPARGNAAPTELVVKEHGVPFLVRLGDGLSTGLFLDQRENRRRIQELARGCNVLNLFAYTCGFSLAAAVGGARRTVSVDVAKTALAWGERNFELAGIARDAHRFVDADVFDTLASFERGKERFDLIVLDPPTFSTTRSSRFDSGTSYRDLAARCFGLLTPGGRLLACSNDRRMQRVKLRRYLHEAARERDRNVKQMKDMPVQRDFPVAEAGEPFMKAVLVTLA